MQHDRTTLLRSSLLNVQMLCPDIVCSSAMCINHGAHGLLIHMLFVFALCDLIALCSWFARYDIRTAYSDCYRQSQQLSKVWFVQC